MPVIHIDLKSRPYDYVKSWVPVMYGQHDGRGNYYYQAECTFCGLRNCGLSTELATFNHYIHCSRKHFYVFEEDYPIVSKPKDETLQQAIRLAMLYDLPMPGYEIHDDCVWQMQQNKKVCILHNMEGSCALRGRMHWLGYI